MNLRSRTGAIVLIIVGTLFLLVNLGVVPQLGPLLRQWWPLILIAIGIIMLALLMLGIRNAWDLATALAQRMHERHR